MDSTTVDKNNQEGGSEWELSEAIRLMGEAQASGDPEQIATAMRRHAEALTNAANTTMIPTLKSVLETVLKKEVGVLTLRLDNSDRARLQRNAEFQKELNDRLDGHARVLDEDVKRLAASVEGAAQLAGKAHALAGQAVAGVEALAGVVSDQGEKIDDMDARLVLVEETPGTSPDLARRITILSYSVGMLVLLWVLILLATLLR